MQVSAAAARPPRMVIRPADPLPRNRAEYRTDKAPACPLGVCLPHSVQGGAGGGAGPRVQPRRLKSRPPPRLPLQTRLAVATIRTVSPLARSRGLESTAARAENRAEQGGLRGASQPNGRAGAAREGGGREGSGDVTQVALALRRRTRLRLRRPQSTGLAYAGFQPAAVAVGHRAADGIRMATEPPHDRIGAADPIRTNAGFRRPTSSEQRHLR
jgi:hypothetical protein